MGTVTRSGCAVVALVLIASLCNGAPLRDERLFDAAYAGRLSDVKALVGQGYPLDARSNDTGRTALHAAAIAGNDQVLEFLAKEGANVEARDDSGRTPLHLAVRSRRGTTVEVLLFHGARVNTRDVYGRTPLHEAVVQGEVRSAEALLEAGARTDLADNEGRTALEMRVSANREQMATLLGRYTRARQGGR